MNEKEFKELASKDGWLKLIVDMQTNLETINRLKGLPADLVDVRSLSIAATHLETAMLWVANAKP